MEKNARNVHIETFHADSLAALKRDVNSWLASKDTFIVDVRMSSNAAVLTKVGTPPHEEVKYDYSAMILYKCCTCKGNVQDT